MVLAFLISLNTVIVKIFISIAPDLTIYATIGATITTTIYIYLLYNIYAFLSKLVAPLQFLMSQIRPMTFS